METATLAAARAYVRAGLSVLPVRSDGSKAPATPKWKDYQYRLPTEAEIEEWFGKGQRTGIGIISGAVSGGLELIDFDAEAETIYPAWGELVEAEVPGLLGQLCVVKTPKGFHARYRCTETPIPGNTKLAMTADRPVKVLIETRGEGGYGLAPGSPLECHDSRLPYTHHSGPELSQIQTITSVERETLIRCARSFDRSAAAEPHETIGNHDVGLSPGDDYSSRGPDWSEILEQHGWACVRQQGHVRYWRRPGKDGAGWSATTGRCSNRKGHDLFCVFSTNADPFPGPVNGRACSSHSKFSAFTLLYHGGDFKVAARVLAADGFGVRRSQLAGQINLGEATGLTGYQIILEHFRQKYNPVFRRETALYSGTLGRQVKPGEALAGAGIELIGLLATAIDAPRNDSGVKRSGLPWFFKTWAPSAWRDLLDSLPDEPATEEISDPAREQFRGRVMAVMAALVNLAYKHQRRDGTVEVQRRSIADWARIFAKPGRWEGVRGYKLWCRWDEGRLRIALRVELFSQIPGFCDLAFLGQRKLGALAELYDVGTGVKVQGGETRAIELAQAFVAELFAEPETDGPEQTDAGARAYAGDPRPSRGENAANP
jgi:putative DNA primase/helicase